MEDEDAAGEADDASGERYQNGFSEEFAQNARALGSEGEAEGGIFGAIGGARGEQAAKVGAGGEQDEAGEKHEAGHKGAGRTSEHVADQAGMRQCEIQTFIVRGVGFCQPCGDGVQVGGRVGDGDSRLEMAYRPE